MLKIVVLFQWQKIIREITEAHALEVIVKTDLGY